MTLSMALLIALICLAFMRPVAGLVVLLAITSSLFHLDRFATMPLPIGYLAPIEAMIAAMAVRWLLSFVPLQRQIIPRASHPLERTVIWALVPYLIWQLICTTSSLQGWAGTEHLRYTLRFMLNGILPFLVPILILRLTRRTAGLFRSGLYIALATAAVHLVFQLTDYRELMSAAYIRRPENGEYDFVFDNMTQWINSAEFVRLLPQGLLLILFFAVYLATKYLVDSRRTRTSLVFGLVLIAALFSTLTRSVILCLFAGIVFGLFFGRRFGLVRLSTAVRICVFIGVLTFGLTAYQWVRPEIVPAWISRIEALSGAEGNAFDPANGARGLDNLSSWNAIVDHPITGLGTPRYPSEYSLRGVPPTDIHPTLQVGLVGGIPAMLLSILMQLAIIRALMKRARRSPAVARDLAPILAVLTMNALVVNTIGAGGTLFGNGTLAVVLFIIEGCRVAADQPLGARILRIVPALGRRPVLAGVSR